MVNILIVDHDKSRAQTLERIVSSHAEISMIHVTTRARECLPLLRRHDVGLVLTEPFPHDLSSSRLLKQLKHYSNPFIKTLSVVCGDDVSTAVHLSMIGVDGVICEKSLFEIPRMIDNVLSGKKYIHPDLVSNLSKFYQAYNFRKKLSVCEYEVLARLNQGFEIKMIAETHMLGVKSVQNSKSRAIKKLKEFKEKEEQALLF